MTKQPKSNRHLVRYALASLGLLVAMTALSPALRADIESMGTCGGASVDLPFNDVQGNFFFCAIAEAYFSGLSSGTTPTTYSPAAAVPREQMAAFVTRTLDQSLRRGSNRAALDQFWTTQAPSSLALTPIGSGGQLVKSDGADLWVANIGNATVSRVRASDGKLLEQWTGATGADGVLVAMGRVFITGSTSPGKLYMLDPRQPAGAVTEVTTALGNFPGGIAFDGQRIWTANGGGSISIISLNPANLNPTFVTNISTGFNSPAGVLYDGANIWVADFGDNAVKKLDSDGVIIQSVTVPQPILPAFDGTNLWVPNGGTNNTVSVVRASTGAVVATLGGNGLDHASQAAFDGERILVTNFLGNSVSLWKATDLAPLGNFSTGAGTGPYGVCSDGLNFWIVLNGVNKLARF